MTRDLKLILDYGDNKNHSANHHIRNMLSHLVLKHDFQVIIFDDILENMTILKDYLQTRFGVFNNVFMIAYEGVSRFEKMSNNFYSLINLCLIVDDIHQAKSISAPRKKVFPKCKYLFLTYAYHFEKYFQRHNSVYLVPHALAYRVDFNNNPTKKILVSGHLNSLIYPNRDKMVLLSKTNNNIQVFKPDYTGYKIEDKNRDKTYGEKYYKLLNSYLCCVADDLIIERRYVICKFFEIMGCGSLLIAFNSNTKTIFEELGLIDMTHYISINETNYETIVNFVMDDANRSIIDKIRLGGYNFANKYHHYTNRAEYINKIISQESNNEYSTDVITGTKYIKYELVDGV